MTSKKIKITSSKASSKNNNQPLFGNSSAKTLPMTRKIKSLKNLKISTLKSSTPLHNATFAMTRNLITSKSNPSSAL